MNEPSQLPVVIGRSAALIGTNEASGLGGTVTVTVTAGTVPKVLVVNRVSEAGVGEPLTVVEIPEIGGGVVGAVATDVAGVVIDDGGEDKVTVTVNVLRVTVSDEDVIGKLVMGNMDEVANIRVRSLVSTKSNWYVCETGTVGRSNSNEPGAEGTLAATAKGLTTDDRLASRSNIVNTGGSGGLVVQRTVIFPAFLGHPVESGCVIMNACTCIIEMKKASNVDNIIEELRSPRSSESIKQPRECW